MYLINNRRLQKKPFWFVTYVPSEPQVTCLLHTSQLKLSSLKQTISCRDVFNATNDILQ